MTTERAIELLHRLQNEQFDGTHGDERRKALEMAVRALESNLVKESGNLVKDLVEDTISRQQAIDALDKHIDMFDAIDTNYLCGLRTAMSILKEMPSAQPEPSQVARDICTILENEQDMRVILKNAQPERKTGKWIKLDMHAHIADHKCTACGQECYVPTCMGEPMYAYCPNCGADMRGESDE